MNLAERQQMQENKKPLTLKIITYLSLFIISIASIIGGGLYFTVDSMIVIRLCICIVFANILVLFSFSASVVNNTLYGDNTNHPIRFCLIYILMILLSLIFTSMPIAAWPYTAIFALLVLMSNISTGIITGMVCLCISIVFEGSANITYFMIYMLCGILISILLGNLDKEFKIALPLIISEVVLICGLSVIELTKSDEISFDIFIYPIVNAIITLILLFTALKIYSSKVVFVESDKYLDINDPECELLCALKSTVPDEYYKSIHVAYFCDRLARKLGMDENVLKCAGYYHRVGSLTGDNSWTNTYKICEEQELPEEVINILSEFLGDTVKPIHAETAVLYMSECIVSSVKYLFSKDKNIQLELSSLVEAIFKQRIDTGIFSSCNITMKQFEDMKTVFVEEKLYYDFLR